MGNCSMSRSDDFKLLMDFLFKQKRRVEKVTINVHNDGRGYVENEHTKITFVNCDETFVSDEADVAEYAWHLKQTVDSDGEYELINFKNLEQYYKDIEFLLDKNSTNTQQAGKDLADGKYTFSFDPDKLIEEFILSKKRKSKRFMPLKTENFYIIAYEMGESARALKMKEKMQSRSVDFERHYLGCEAVYAKAFRNQPNFIKNFLKQKSTNDFSLLDYSLQVQSVMQHVNIMKDLFPKQGMPAHKGVSLLLDMYRRYAESCVKPLNLLRIAQEISSGNSSPDLKKSAGENKRILQPVMGDLLECYDPRIRNSESHLSTEIDAGNKKVRVYRTIRGNRNLQVEYTFQEIANMTNGLMHNLVPALALTVYMEWRTMLLVLTYKSMEYKLALLSIGNS